jgi:sporulation protein YlmC with PRC-barrel domain
MTRSSLFTTAIFSTLLLSTAAAQDGAQNQDAPKKPGGYTRASLLQGLDVHNNRNEDIGNASDLVVDLKDQTVAYVAIGVGGTVRADRFVPVKFQDIGLSQDGKYFVYNSTKEQLSSAAGFDKTWMVPSGVKGQEYGQNTAWRTSALIGMNVQNEQGETLGKVNDLVINLADGKILYAALSHGGVAGVGDKLFAVPLNAMSMRSLTLKPNDHVFVISGVTKQQLDAAGGFDQKNWPNTPNTTIFKAVER